MNLTDLLKASKRPSQETLEKMTSNDKGRVLGSSLESHLQLERDDRYEYDLYLYDYDETHIYISLYNYTTWSSVYYKLSYTLSGVSVTFGTELVEVFPTTNWEEVSQPDAEDSTEKAFVKLLKKFNLLPQTPVIKQVNVGTTIEYAYISAGEVDLHGDGYFNSEEVYKMVDSMNEHKPSGNYLHTVNTDDFSLVKAFVVEEETLIEKADGTTETIPAKTPMLEVAWHDEEKLELRKSGVLQPPSIGAKATIIDISSGAILEKNADVILGTGSVVKSESNTKRLLKDINFADPSSHFAMTADVVGGPASGKDGYFETTEMNVAKTQKVISQEQMEFLTNTLGYSEEELLKQKTSLATNQAGTEETPNEDLNKTQEDTMDQVAVVKAVALCNTLTKFGFEGDAVAQAIATLPEDVCKTIVEGFEFLHSAKDEELNTLKSELATAKEELVTKSATATADEENPVFKESGHSEEPEAKVYPDTFQGRLQKQKDETLAKEGAK